LILIATWVNPLGLTKWAADEEVIKHITSANMPAVFTPPIRLLWKDIKLCKEHGVKAGAHPGYPDLLGFGRRAMAVSSGTTIMLSIKSVLFADFCLS